MERSQFDHGCKGVEEPGTINTESSGGSVNGIHATSSTSEIQRRSTRNKPNVAPICKQTEGCCEEQMLKSKISIQDKNFKKLSRPESKLIPIGDNGSVDKESETSEEKKHGGSCECEKIEELEWKKQDGTGEEKLNSDETSEEEGMSQTETSDEEEMSQTETSEEGDMDIDITSSEYDSSEEEELISQAGTSEEEENICEETSEEEENICEETSEEEETSEDDEVISQDGTGREDQKIKKESSKVEETSYEGMMNQAEAGQGQDLIPELKIEKSEKE